MANQTGTDFFVSYAAADELWAEWAAWELEEAGYTTLLQAWDFRPGQNFVLDMQEASSGTSCTIAILSPDYLASRFTQSEWAAALARDPTGTNRLLIPVLVRPCDLRGLLGQITCVDMVGLDEEGSRSALLAGVSQERAKPTVQPSFPGITLRSVPQQPVFPGTSPAPGVEGIAQPRFRTRQAQTLSAELEAAYIEQEKLAIEGEDTLETQERILRLRRKLREGGQLQAGDILGKRFKLIHVLGMGGFAKVWKAFDRSEQELVAVKVLHGQFAEDRTRRERFFRGARRMGALRHPGIVPVLDKAFEDEGYYYFVMELVDGPDLNKAILEQPPSMDERIRILLELGEALQFAHEERMVHRDIKPANILLQNGRTPKLTDFDLVHVSDTTGGTRSGMLGTVVYAAPETWMDASDADVTTDVYSFGMTCVFALAGKTLPLEVIRDAPAYIRTLRLPEPIREVLTRAVAWDPKDRYASVRALCEDMENPRLQPPHHAPKRPMLEKIRNVFGRPKRRGLRAGVAEMRDMTVLFSDVRGMTSISESLAPAELAAFMDAFLNPLSEVIEHFGGTVDNYMGDAIMAHWGSPPGDERHARNAIEAGLEMIATLDRLEPTFQARGWPTIRIGVGINSGPMIYGRFAAKGSATVMGDAVNLGSRLEGLTKGYGAQIITGQATVDKIEDHVFLELDRVRVKGKDAPLTIFEPLGPQAKMDKNTIEEVETHRRALQCYLDGQWGMAEIEFTNLRQRHPEKALYPLYVERIGHLRNSPPEANWDGVFTFATR